MKTKILILLLFSLCATSCRSTKITSTNEAEERSFSGEKDKQVEIVFVEKTDSVIIQTKGDTVFYDRWRTRYIDRIKADTLIKTDTTYISRIELVTKEKSLSWWQKIQIKGFWILFVAFLLIAGYTILKWYLKIRKIRVNS